MRNIARRAFSTPKRNIMGSVMSRMHTATQTERRMTGTDGPSAPGHTATRTVCSTKEAAAAAAVESQPKTYLLSTRSRSE